MPWSSSRLVSSLRGSNALNRARASGPGPVAGVSHSPRASDSANRENWSRSVEESRDVLEFLVSGHPRIGSTRLESLGRSTADYLTVWRVNHPQPSTECDQILDALIVEHAGAGCLTRDVAILACLYALSIPAAIKHLVSLMDLNVERYLRCITLASQANPNVVSGVELRSAQSLLQILSRQGNDFQLLQRLIETLGSGMEAVLVPLPIVQGALENSGIRSRLQRELNSHSEQKKFMSTFLLVSWLQSVPGISNNGITTVLDTHFPSWPLLQAWRPNIERINQWEFGTLSNTQRKKLSCAFDLDGPDKTIHRRESLKAAEPECYEYVHVHPRSTETLERFLDLLYRAQTLGTGALELFIHLCIDNLADETALSMVDSGIRAGDDSYCSRLLVLHQALGPQPRLGRQMVDLTKALSILNNQMTHQKTSFPTDRLADRLNSVMSDAQAKFCSQLEKGTGEYIGMLIYDLGAAILQASRTHSSLSPNLLAQVRKFPSQEVLETMFDELRNHVGLSIGDNHFKTYLASALGGRGSAEAGPITFDAIQEEIEFWKHPPDTLRRDFSKSLAKVKNEDYSLYTACLLATLKEDDVFIREMRHTIATGGEQTCINFLSYLTNRRRLNQLQDGCWPLLLMSLIKEQGPSFLPRMSESVPSGQWLKLVDDLTYMATPISLMLSQSGVGLTQETLSWWVALSRKTTAVRFLLERQGGRGSLRWLYFPPRLGNIMDLLDIANSGPSMIPVHRQIVSYLSPDGNNAGTVSDCIHQIKNTSTIGWAVCERVLFRKEAAKWSDTELDVLLEAWSRSASLTRLDKSALDLIRRLLRFPIPSRVGSASSQSASGQLQSDYDLLLNRARNLETFRLRLRRQNPERISTLLQQLGVDSTSLGRAADVGIPHELLDAIETVSESEYELSFALTGLSDLQRQARGISKKSRMLVVCLSLQGSPGYCLHFSPDEEGRGRHDYWRPADGGPKSAICTTRPNLFTYYLARKLSQLLRRRYSLESIHSATLKLLTRSPATCIVCCGSMGANLWKPVSCSQNCTTKLRKAPLEVRLHNLLVDPRSIDLLLCCVYEAAADQSNLDLLPGCPVQKANIRAVIDSLPPLASLQTATNLKAAIRGHDMYGPDRERLLSWLCLAFRGFMMTAPDGFRVPSMPNTQQFLMLNSNHERERLFKEQAGPLGSGVVFHGTHVSRLFLVLTEGLKVMSNTAFMINGAAFGAGIYCGNDQSGSLGYMGVLGQSWSNSELGNMRIMLGCELAAYTPPPTNSVVVTDENKLLVRYIFLLPHGYQAPPRHHVEPAMMASIAKLRSGLRT
ncbi:MAG: hypothetical protein M1840_003797 [Geoglossum simile]|nr:MAG: hypothetical protein M1840_003797 [Geoglossum simile]